MSKNDQTLTISDLAALVDDDKRGVAKDLADEITFMRSTLDSLREHIGEHGPIEWYENGKQACWRESPATKAYTGMMPRYLATMKALVALLPDDADEADELTEWLANN